MHGQLRSPLRAGRRGVPREPRRGDRRGRRRQRRRQGRRRRSAAAGPTRRARGRGRPDTVVDVFSTGKAFVALTVLSLGLDLDAPAWQDATLRQVLSHQAGHPAIREELPAEATYDWDRIVGRAGVAGALVAAGHRSRLPRQHVRLHLRGDRAPRERRAAARALRAARRRRDAGVTFGAPAGVGHRRVRLGPGSRRLGGDERRDRARRRGSCWGAPT